jgi:hypothetical protein
LIKEAVETGALERYKDLNEWKLTDNRWVDIRF